MDNQQVTEAELGWLAGIIDGEGSLIMSLLTCTRNNRLQYCPKITIPNSSAGLIAKSVNILDRLNVGCGVYEKNSTHLGKKQMWQIMVGRMVSIQRLLGFLIPYLTCKKPHAELMYRFVTLRIPKKNVGETVDRYYTQEEIDLYESFRLLRDYTCDSLMGEDIVRSASRGAEVSRNDLPLPEMEE